MDKKITERQMNALQLINEQKKIHQDDCRIHGNTLNALQYDGLVVKWNYANGGFYVLTDKGLNIIGVL